MGRGIVLIQDTSQAGPQARATSGRPLHIWLLHGSCKPWHVMMMAMGKSSAALQQICRKMCTHHHSHTNLRAQGWWRDDSRAWQGLTIPLDWILWSMLFHLPNTMMQ
jgi:hypothetical protein